MNTGDTSQIDAPTTYKRSWSQSLLSAAMIFNIVAGERLAQHGKEEYTFGAQ